MNENLIDAIMNCDIQIVHSLIAEGVDVNAKDNEGLTALMWAAFRGYTDIAKILIDKGADVNAKDNIGFTALMRAAFFGQTDIVKILINMGADVNAPGPNGNRPYDYAPHRNIRNTKQYLWEKGGRPGNPNNIFILGTGFTKAFYDQVPLLVDNWNIHETLIPKYEKFDHAKKLLEAELKQQEKEDGCNKGRINVERLMTRLASGMPYDALQGAKPIIDALLSDLKQIFIEQIRLAYKKQGNSEELEKLAEYCVRKKVNFITFNYDYTLDAAIETVTSPTVANFSMRRLWNPYLGYGFYCPSVYDPTAPQGQVSNKQPISRILKMHGSMNWYPCRGASAPYRVNDIRHTTPWRKGKELSSDTILPNIPMEEVESVPFIIPPILTKTDLTEQPLMQLIWGSSLFCVGKPWQTPLKGMYHVFQR